MLERIHESHQGIVKCKQRARDILFWSGMSSQIEDKVSKHDGPLLVLFLQEGS